MSFPRYPSYKASGVEWLGDVPEHWEIVPLRFTFQNLDHKRIPLAGEDRADLEKTYPYYGASGIIDLVDDYLFEETLILVAEDGANLLSRSTPLAFLATGKYWVNNHAHILKPNSGDALFWSSLLQSYDYTPIVTGAAQPKLTADRLGSIRLPKPSGEEQTKIASFIGCETSKIDELVAEKRRLIELLKEKRQSIISHAVTKGLNPHAPLKSSGIEWLGDVPAHWEVDRMANVFREVADSGTEDLPILSVSIHHGVSDKEFNDEEMDRKVTRSDDRSKYKRVAPGDLVYNMMRAWQGGFGTVTVEGMVSPAYVVARPKTSITTTYVEHLLRTPQAIEQMRRHSRGITDFRLRLYWDEFKNIRIPLPPEHEAVEICRAIKLMDNSFNELTAEAERAIQLLQERRSALISAAVTGKIDVRELSNSETKVTTDS
ncbi:MAG: restriction endonuclease subunit S [Pyrinomonadaceae bacterium]